MTQEQLLRRWPAAWAGSTMLLLFFSEFLFFNEGPALALIEATAARKLLHLAELLAFYALLSAVLLACLQAFHVRRWPAIVLAGAIYGWACEGSIIPYVYEGFPITFIWTPVGWHALIDVGLGLFLLPRLLGARRLTAPLLLAVFWGLWTTWITPDVDLAPTDMLILSLWSGPLLIGGMALWIWSGPGQRVQPVWFGRTAAGIALAFAILNGAALWPLLAILLGLTALCVLALSRFKPEETGSAPVSAKSALWLIPVPPLAAGIFAAAQAAGLAIPAEDTALALSALGTGALIVALIKALRA